MDVGSDGFVLKTARVEHLRVWPQLRITMQTYCK